MQIYILLEQSLASVSLDGVKQTNKQTKTHSANKLLFNINPFSPQVCGERGLTPCGHLPCGALSCHGSLTLSRNDFQKAQEAESVMHNLNNQVQGLKNQVNDVFSDFICKVIEIEKQTIGVPAMAQWK